VRRYLFVILFVIVLAAPFILRAVVKTNDAARATAGALRLVVITPHNQDIRREFARAFNAWHLTKYGQSVEIDYRVPGGTHDIKRQLEDTYRSWRIGDGSLDPRFVPDIHVVWGGGGFFFDKELKPLLKPLCILQPMRLDQRLLTAAFPQRSLAGVRLYEESTDLSGEPAPKWVGVCLSAFGIVYNPDVYRGLGLPEPKTWQDLTDPRLVGQLALADPTHSGSAATAYMMVIERRMADAEESLFANQPELRDLPQAQRETNPTYVAAIAAGWKRGMSELLLIAANSRYFVDSASQVPSDVGNGDAAAGIAIDFYGRVYQDVVGPQRCRVVLPAGATAISPDPVAILEGVRGKDLERATHFVEFLLTAEGQLLWIVRPGQPGGPVERALRRSPARRDLYQGDRAGWTDEVNPFEQSQGFNERPEFETLFRETRPIWTAAWIDSREALKSAYDAIVHVADPMRRDALIAELADLPITMQDVAQYRQQLKQIESMPGRAQEWKAATEISRVKSFRAHFKRVADKAHSR
jgi:iron(III) transport system substrate-binding protein